eukprot:CAMPEP_0197823626 /NCGR_PEP_ID=MMETSP1437-20131217/949_1 /TAXON_ID=49252 ORGANISM="Eucampia antarctica, Strain CCMP1452" /NCGR_SAMPLE_ID=MMETSP1437 /ASSEMBLY_ACC=CAM_ASM_001096 /LENGTH=438 /DNA_ID=CAMNT_0043422879 /DNA_START=64 /DNA_END=1380 /DNA_ORIENTATION=-
MVSLSSVLLRIIGVSIIALGFPNAVWSFTTTSRTMSVRNDLSSRLYESADEPKSAIDDMSEERRANVYQSLLRDLQIEGVPLLGCDADAVQTMNAALWTTMAEVNEGDDANSVCMVMEKLPINGLQAFVDDFTALKTQDRLMQFLPELRRISVSLVGKGVGPAMIIETAKRTEEECDEKRQRDKIEASLDEAKEVKAMRSFVDRIVIQEEACPYTKSVDMAATGLEPRGVKPGPVGYRYSSCTDACAAVGIFWNYICELINLPEEELSTTILSLPGIGRGTTEEAHDRFAAVVELVSRNLCLFRGDAMFGLVHFHPAYDRQRVHPTSKPAYGHLPPRSFMRAILRQNRNTKEADEFTDEQINLSDYQRRSPHTAINMLRTTQLNAAAGAKSIVELDMGDGVIEKASGITTYSRNAIRLAKIGEEILQKGVQDDIAMTN